MRRLLSAFSLIGMLALDGYAANAQCAGGACPLPAANYGLRFAPIAPAYPNGLTAAPYYPAGSVRYVQPNPPAVVATPAPPRKYELADIDGRGWVHSDLAHLRSWVDGRNAGLESARAKAVVRTSAVTACPGSCNSCVTPQQCGHEGCGCVANVPPPLPGR